MDAVRAGLCGLAAEPEAAVSNSEEDEWRCPPSEPPSPELVTSSSHCVTRSPHLMSLTTTPKEEVHLQNYDIDVASASAAPPALSMHLAICFRPQRWLLINIRANRLGLILGFIADSCVLHCLVCVT